MKAVLYDARGEKKSEIDLPKVFESVVREDLLGKCAEAEKFDLLHPYSPAPEAGRRHSASGVIKHARHKWKGHYGKGMARLPRKTMWRRGTQFYWIGAEVSNTRGGRTIHAPTGEHRSRKINAKEWKLALASGLAATMHAHYITRHYPSLKHAPSAAVIESLPSKTKELLDALKRIYGNAFSVVLQKKTVRAGRGKLRGRKYKSTAGILVVTGRGEKVTQSGLHIKQRSELMASDLYPLGRLTLYTKKAMEELAHA